MKHINIKLLSISLLTSLLVLSGCLVDEQWDIKNGGYAGANIYPSNSSFFKGETTSVEIAFDLYENEGVSVSEIKGTIYLNSNLGDSDPVEFMVSGSPYTLTSQELFSQHPVGGNVLTEEDLAPGDAWVISYDLSMSDGVQLTPGNGSSITFTCKSDLAGAYSQTTNWTDYYGNKDTNTDDVEFTALEADGQYIIPDLSGGMEPIIWGGDPVMATIQDICDVITLVDAPYSYPYYIDEGYVDADGRIYIKWRNAYDENGETWYTLK